MWMTFVISVLNGFILSGKTKGKNYKMIKIENVVLLFSSDVQYKRVDSLTPAYI